MRIITLEVPDDVAAQLEAMPPERRNHYATAYLRRGFEEDPAGVTSGRLTPEGADVLIQEILAKAGTPTSPVPDPARTRSAMEFAGVHPTGRTAEEVDAYINEMREERERW